MERKNQILETPKNTTTKRLGLRGASSALKDKTALLNVSATPNRKSEMISSVATVSYGSEKVSKKISSLASTTPSISSSNEVNRRSKSTNCRPLCSRLASMKNLKEKSSKKRLQFHLADETDTETPEADNNEPETYFCKTYSKSKIENDHVEEYLSGISKEEVLAQIDEMEKELEARRQHTEKAKELKLAIETWQAGFKSALQELQTKIEPKESNEQLLEKLQLPPDLITYVED